MVVDDLADAACAHDVKVVRASERACVVDRSGHEEPARADPAYSGSTKSRTTIARSAIDPPVSANQVRAASSSGSAFARARCPAACRPRETGSMSSTWRPAPGPGNDSAYRWYGGNCLPAPPPEEWPIHDARESIERLDELLTLHHFARDPARLVLRNTVDRDDDGRILAAWIRWREFDDCYERAARDETPYTADTVVVWAGGQITFDILGHRATFDRWPTAWACTAIQAVIAYVGPGTGPS